MGAIGGGLKGAKIGSMAGPIGSAIGAGLGALGGALTGGGAKAAAPVGPVSGVTQEQLLGILKDLGIYTSGANINAATPVTVGGVGVTQSSEISPTQQKTQAYIQYRMAQGDSFETAKRKAQAIVSNPNLTFKGDKGFRKSVAQGNYEGLSIGADGKIAAAPKFKGGGVETPGSSEALQNVLKALGLESSSAAMGQAPMFANDNRSAFAFRDATRNSLASILGDTGPEGLSSRDLADIDATLGYRKQQLADLNRTNTAGVVGDLIDRGFMSSNLAESALQKGVFDPQARFLSELGGELADKELAMRNASAARKAQAVGNLNSSFASAGSPYQINSILGGIVDPSQAGLFDDVSGAYLANTIQQQGLGNRRADQSMVTAAGLTPTLSYPNQSILSNPLFGAGAVALGKYITNRGTKKVA